MKAAVFDREGPPGVLRYLDVPDPQLHSGDVLLRVEAISIEGGDLINRRNLAPPRAGYVVGYAAAGLVVAIGDDVTDRKVGDRITSWGLCGSHAQLRAVPANQTWSLPPGVGVAEAAAIPIGFGTAHHCLFARGGLSSLMLDLWPAVQRNQSVLGVFMGGVLPRAEVRRISDAMLGDLLQGRLRVPISARFPLSEAEAGHRHFEDNKILGPVVLIP